MVTLDYIARSALRYDTVVAFAFRRVLGISHASSRRVRGSSSARIDRYAGAEELMRQDHGVIAG